MRSPIPTLVRLSLSLYAAASDAIDTCKRRQTVHLPRILRGDDRILQLDVFGEKLCHDGSLGLEHTKRSDIVSTAHC